MSSTAAKPNYGFDMIEGEGYTEFNVVPPALDTSGKWSMFFFKFSSSFVLIVMGFIAAAVIGGMFNSGNFFLLLLVGLGVLVYKNVRTMQSKLDKMLVPVSIKVNHQGISVNQTQFAREHIVEFWTQFGEERHQAHVTEANVVREASGSQAAGAHVGAAAANAINKRMYSVQMRYAADDVKIAEALPPGTANALLEKLLIAYRATA